MLKVFNENILKLVKDHPGKKYLLAVSGGLDSVVMAELFFLAGFDFSIAHCNFQLRGKESDGDERHVKKLATDYKVPFYSIKFDTEKYCADNKVSVQMGARQLRYNWLEEIRKQYKLDYLVTAHHADDAIETFFINLLRGTGIAGLHGINAIHGNLIRPMLIFSRKNIELFAKENKLEWREDSSNETDKYERNKIRHHLIPALEKIEPQAKNAMSHTMDMLRLTEEIYKDAITGKASQYVKEDTNKTTIQFGLFKNLKLAPLYLFELLKGVGFNYSQCEQIVESSKGQPGKMFLSETHKLVIDRGKLIVEKRAESGGIKEMVVTEKLEELLTKETHYSFRIRKRTTHFLIPQEATIATIDYDKLTFPLKIRKWQKGDKFYPLGMKKPKKVSDFLINSKIPLPDKERVYVLQSDNDIVWVIGYRLDERYKVTKATKKLYLCNSQKAITL